MSVFSMFSTEDFVPTTEIECLRLYPSDGSVVDHRKLEIRFYNIGDLGYTLNIVDSDGVNICDLILSKDQMTDLVVKAEVAQA